MRLSSARRQETEIMQSQKTLEIRLPHEIAHITCVKISALRQQLRIKKICLEAHIARDFRVFGELRQFGNRFPEFVSFLGHPKKAAQGPPIEDLRLPRRGSEIEEQAQQLRRNRGLRDLGEKVVVIGGVQEEAGQARMGGSDRDQEAQKIRQRLQLNCSQQMKKRPRLAEGVADGARLRQDGSKLANERHPGDRLPQVSVERAGDDLGRLALIGGIAPLADEATQGAENRAGIIDLDLVGRKRRRGLCRHRGGGGTRRGNDEISFWYQNNYITMRN